MTRLILMRHAKSSWKDPTLGDHARPLNKRGRRDAPAMAERLAARGWVPELALVSDAARTEETWAWMAERLGEPPFHLIPALYHGTLDAIRDAVQRYHGGCRTVLVLGHNPGWEEAVAELCGHTVIMKTANAALLRHHLPWERALQRDDWVLDALLVPPPRSIG